jgi:hypothetical protein
MHLAIRWYGPDYKWITIQCGLKLNEKFNKRRVKNLVANEGAIVYRAVRLTIEQEFHVWCPVYQVGCIDQFQIWDM